MPYPLLLTLLLAPVPISYATPRPQPCKADQLSLNIDPENGSFNGMSHSGTLLVLRNISSTPCTIPPHPQITFLKNSQPQPATAKPAHSNHPPKNQPVVIISSAELTATLRWVSAPVYPNSTCITPDHIAVTIQAQKQQTPIAAHICGAKSTGITYQANPLTPDPTYASH